MVSSGEMAEGAVLSTGVDDPASLAAQLMLVYKQEDLRRDLIGRGFDRVAAFSRERSFGGVWEGIRRTLAPLIK